MRDFTKIYFHLNSSAVYNSSAKNSVMSTFLPVTGVPVPAHRFAVCIDSNGTWHGSEFFYEGHPICEWKGAACKIFLCVK